MYPLYWQSNKNTFWLKTGGSIVTACLTVRETENRVEFAFYDAGNKYLRSRQFPSPRRARNFAIKFGRLMRKLDQESKVPVPATFEKFF